MQNSTIVFLINEDVRAIAAIYEKDGPKTLFKTLDPSVEVGDFVVVESSTRHGMTVVEVVEVDVEFNIETQGEMKWIVQAISMNRHEEVLAQEQAAIAAVQSAERARKKRELKAALFADHEDKLKTLALANQSDDEVTE